MALTPALITFFGFPINLFVKDIKVTFLKSSRYLILSLNTGPIIILTPFLYNSLDTLKVSIGFDFVSLGIISILSSLILFIANLVDLIIFSLN